MKVFLSFLLFIYCLRTSAQDSLVTIKAGYKVSDVLSQSDIFYYPQYKEGKVIFKDATKGIAKLNYSRVFDQILFIDPKNDTLALADEKMIAYIAVDQDTFFYDNGYMRLIKDFGDVKLAEKQAWIVADIRKIGTHNRQANTVAVSSLTAYTNGSDAAKSKDLILNEDILLRKETQYFFGDRYNHFVRASKKGLLHFFANYEAAIETYLRQNKIDFEKKEDLEKIAHYVTGH